MGWDYAKVHIYFTIPPALILWWTFRRIRTSRDVFLTSFLVTVAFVSTIPWDSYLVRTQIWSYPPHAVMGPTLFFVPIEELFFFVIQTYITSQLYLVLSKPVLHPLHLPRHSTSSQNKYLGTTFLASVCILGLVLTYAGGVGTYLGLILLWSGPFMLFLWILASSHLVSLPLTCTALPILLPTLYLWLVDTLSLRRGTWSISTGTKLGWYLWPNLEIEEAIFFLVTNVMIVFGLVAASKAFAIWDTFGSDVVGSPIRSACMNAIGLDRAYMLLRALLVNPSRWPRERLDELDMAYDVLRHKEHGKSFLAASMLFEGRERIGLLQLYALCRICDNLIDDAPSPKEAEIALQRIRQLMNNPSYHPTEGPTSSEGMNDETASIAALYPSLAARIPRKYFDQLIDGFHTDLQFTPHRHPSAGDSVQAKTEYSAPHEWPIQTNADLMRYSQCVAGSVAGMCVHLLWPGISDEDKDGELDFTADTDLEHRPQSVKSRISTTAPLNVLYHAQRVGRALQLVNIARDIRVDARQGQRCYIPARWLAEHTPYIFRQATGRALGPADIVDYVNRHPPQATSIPKESDEEFSLLVEGGKTGDAAIDAALEALIFDYQAHLVACARAMYASSGPAIAQMPPGARAGLYVAIEQYLEVGQTLLEYGRGVERVRVPWKRRLALAWEATGKR